MKTIANIIIINRQNVRSEHLLVVIITLVFLEESSITVWKSSIEVANTGLPKLPLDDLNPSDTDLLNYVHIIQVIPWNISTCSFL